MENSRKNLLEFVPGLVYIQVPEKYQDQYMTVIKIKLKDKVHLYRGEGGLDI